MLTKKQKIRHALIFVFIIVAGMIAVNYYVDSYAVIRTTYLDIAKQMEDGYHVVGLAESRYNERYLAVARIEQMEEAPETIVLGTSRSMTFEKEDFDADSFYNFSLSGGTLKDYYGIVGYLANGGLLPDRVIIEIGGPLFYAGDTDNRYTYLQGGIDYLEKKLEGENKKCEIPNLGKQYHKLLAIDYFKYNAQCLWQKTRFCVEFTEAGENECSTRLADGSITYARDARERTVDYVKTNTEQAIASKSLYKIDGYTQMSVEHVASFEKLVNWLLAQGVKVELFLPPYSEPIYDFICENPQYYSGVLASEEYIVRFAEENDLILYGSYSPKECGIVLEDLYDAYHLRREKDAKALYLR